MKRVFLVVVLLAFVGLLSASFVVLDDLVKMYNSSIGESMTGTIHVFNPQSTAVRIRISQADFTYNANEENFFLEPGKYHRSNADWIRFMRIHTIPANQSVHVPFTISVPNRRALEGSYWSVLIIEEDVELIPRPDEILVAMRYVIQVINTIDNTGRLDMTFRDVVFGHEGLSMILQNTGTVLINAVIRIDIFDTNTELVGRYTFTENRVYPELERRFRFPIEALGRGNYYAIIVVDCGNNRIFGHQVQFRM